MTNKTLPYVVLIFLFFLVSVGFSFASDFQHIALIPQVENNALLYSSGAQQICNISQGIYGYSGSLTDEVEDSTIEGGYLYLLTGKGNIAQIDSECTPVQVYDTNITKSIDAHALIDVNSNYIVAYHADTALTSEDIFIYITQSTGEYSHNITVSAPSDIEDFYLLENDAIAVLYRNHGVRLYNSTGAILDTCDVGYINGYRSLNVIEGVYSYPIGVITSDGGGSTNEKIAGYNLDTCSVLWVTDDASVSADIIDLYPNFKYGKYGTSVDYASDNYGIYIVNDDEQIFNINPFSGNIVGGYWDLSDLATIIDSHAFLTDGTEQTAYIAHDDQVLRYSVDITTSDYSPSLVWNLTLHDMQRLEIIDSDTTVIGEYPAPIYSGTFPSTVYMKYNTKKTYNLNDYFSNAQYYTIAFENSIKDIDVFLTTQINDTDMYNSSELNVKLSENDGDTFFIIDSQSVDFESRFTIKAFNNVSSTTTYTNLFIKETSSGLEGGLENLILPDSDALSNKSRWLYAFGLIILMTIVFYMASEGNTSITIIGTVLGFLGSLAFGFIPIVVIILVVLGLLGFIYLRSRGV